jgi:hypothetical protein
MGKHGIFAQFTDPEMQTAVDQQQRRAGPLQFQAERLHSIETRLRTGEAEDLVFTDEADVRQLLFVLQPVAQARQLVELLKASELQEPKSNVDGNLTVALLRSTTGQQSFKVSIHAGKREEIIDLVEQARQMAHRLMRSNLRTHSNEREGRQAMIEQCRHHPPRRSKPRDAEGLHKTLHNHPVCTRLLPGTNLKG